MKRDFAGTLTVSRSRHGVSQRPSGCRFHLLEAQSENLMSRPFRMSGN